MGMIFWLVIFGIVALIGVGVISLSFENDRMNVDFDKDEFGNLIDDIKNKVPVDVSISD